MITVENPLSGKYDSLRLPDNAMVVRMDKAPLLGNPKAAIRNALDNPIGSPSLSSVASASFSRNPDGYAVILVSDNTRPVPYKGDSGILMPVVDTLLSCGYVPAKIKVLVATGTHRAMTDSELRAMLDERLFNLGIEVVNHDCRDNSTLEYLGTTGRGTEVMIDKLYMHASLKIATGLIESHFMAGASGGRKAVCPGVIGEKTTYVFHGAKLMADPMARDLQIEGNPVHEESLAVARMAGVDFLVNVTLDASFKVTGIFAGDLEKAHLAGVEAIRKHVQVKLPKKADIVVTHGGFVGINHYQCAKCAVASLGVLKQDGWLVIIADTTDSKDAVGSANYKRMLSLLKEQGSDGFNSTISSPGWTFVPDQWQVQQWAKVFKRIPMDHMLMYSPQLTKEQWNDLPGKDGSFLMNGEEDHAYGNYVEKALDWIASQEGKAVSDMDIAYIAEGPYVVPKAD